VGTLTELSVCTSEHGRVYIPAGGRRICLATMGLQATSANSLLPSVEFVRFVLYASLHLSITICASFGEQKCLSTAVPQFSSEIFAIAVLPRTSPYRQQLPQFLANELWASAQTANASLDAPRAHNSETALERTIWEQPDKRGHDWGQYRDSDNSLALKGFGPVRQSERRASSGDMSSKTAKVFPLARSTDEV
jgi:hypothetical protein